jgi:hypothetical protein
VDLQEGRVGASGDDRAVEADYGGQVRLRDLWSKRPDPVKFDRALALVLTIAGELQIAAGGIAGKERLGPALLTAALGRRRSCWCTRAGSSSPGAGRV